MPGIGGDGAGASNLGVKYRGTDEVAAQKNGELAHGRGH
jgi:hypothetical protein